MSGGFSPGGFCPGGFLSGAFDRLPRSGHLYIDDAQSAETMCWKIIYQIFPIFSFGVIGRQRSSNSAKENCSKVAKFTGKMRIDLTMIF